MDFKKCQPVDPELLCTRTLANSLTFTCEQVSYPSSCQWDNFLSLQPWVGPNLSLMRLTRTHYLTLHLRNNHITGGAGERVWWLTTLVSLSENMRPIPNNPWHHQPPEMKLQVQWNQIPFLDFLCTRHAHDTRM